MTHVRIHPSRIQESQPSEGSLPSLYCSDVGQELLPILGGRAVLCLAGDGKGQLYHRSSTEFVTQASSPSEVSTDLKPLAKNPSSQSKTQGSVTHRDKGTRPQKIPPLLCFSGS